MPCGPSTSEHCSLHVGNLSTKVSSRIASVPKIRVRTIVHWVYIGVPFLGGKLPNIKRVARKARSRQEYPRWTPHPVIVTIRDNRDYIRVLLYSYYTTITGWGVLLNISAACSADLPTAVTRPLQWLVSYYMDLQKKVILGYYNNNHYPKPKNGYYNPNNDN